MEQNKQTPDTDNNNNNHVEDLGHKDNIDKAEF